MQTVTASRCEAGKLYKTTRGAPIECLGPIEGSDHVLFRSPDTGREVKLPPAYPVMEPPPPQAPPSEGIASLVNGHHVAVRERIPTLTTDELHELAEKDARMFVQHEVGAELQRRAMTMAAAEATGLAGDSIPAADTPPVSQPLAAQAEPTNSAVTGPASEAPPLPQDEPAAETSEDPAPRRNAQRAARAKARRAEIATWLESQPTIPRLVLSRDGVEILERLTASVASCRSTLNEGQHLDVIRMAIVYGEATGLAPTILGALRGALPVVHAPEDRTFPAAAMTGSTFTEASTSEAPAGGTVELMGYDEPMEPGAPLEPRMGTVVDGGERVASSPAVLGASVEEPAAPPVDREAEIRDAMAELGTTLKRLRCLGLRVKVTLESKP